MMTDLTPEEILDAVDRGLREAWRQFDNGRQDQKHRLEQSNVHVLPPRLHTVSNLTSREILDAIDRGLKAAARQFDQRDGPDEQRAHLVPEPPRDETLQPPPDNAVALTLSDQRR